MMRHLRPDFVKVRLPPQPPCMRRKPLAVALPQSAPPLHAGSGSLAPRSAKIFAASSSMIRRSSGARA